MKDDPIDINEATVKQYVESIRPKDPEIRKQVDISYSYDGKIFILFEILPFFEDPEKISHLDFAKIRYYKSREEWNLYWKRASGKWELYEPFPEASHLGKIIEKIEADPHGCFFG